MPSLAPVDSIRALQIVSRSGRFRAYAVAVWSVLGPFVYAGGGWLASHWSLAGEIAELRVALKENTVAVQALGVRIAGHEIDEQRRTFAVGRYAAYATAGFQAYEPTKTKEQKRAYAEKYAASFERIAKEKGPEVALAALFENVALP